MKDLLIGDNAFIGVSHLSQDHARQRLHDLRLETIMGVFETALSCGATGFSFTVHPTNLEILSSLDNGTISSDLELYPILPYAAGYVRAVNEKGMGGLITDVMSRLSFSDKARVLLRGGVSAVTLDPIGMMKTYMDAELSGILRLKRSHLKTVLLHEVITDLALSFRARNIFDAYIRHVRDNHQLIPGFVTRNLVRFVNFFDEADLPLRDTIIMTPINKLGFQMNPSRENCEACLMRLRDANVIAMSILASGYLSLEEAVEYIQNLPNLSGVVVGVSSKEHAHDSFTRLRLATERQIEHRSNPNEQENSEI